MRERGGRNRADFKERFLRLKKAKKVFFKKADSTLFHYPWVQEKIQQTQFQFIKQTHLFAESNRCVLNVLHCIQISSCLNNCQSF